VARRAGCTHPILYRHFKNRNDLIREAARRLQDHTIKAMSTWAGNEEQTVVERIRGLMDLYLSRRSNREITLGFGAILGSKGRRDPRIRAAFVEGSERYAAIIQGLIEKGMQRGELRDDINARYVTWRLIEMGMFIDYARLFGPPDANLRGYIRMAARSLLQEITPPK
jgi:AcrR family transcriptional regulator